MSERPRPLWKLDCFAPESASIGIKLSQFADAVMVYIMMQQGARVTVGEIMRAFNADRATLESAVEWHPWLFLIGSADSEQGVAVDGE